MRLYLLLILGLLHVPSAFGDTVLDVEILDISITKDGSELKCRDIKGAPESYFTIIFDQKDKDVLKKNSLVINKLLKKEKFNLSLEIDSYSPRPAGSAYKSIDVEFKGKEL